MDNLFKNDSISCNTTPLSAGPAEGFALALSCTDNVLITRVKVLGGSPPYVIIVNQGKLTIIDESTFEVKINGNEPNLSLGGFTVAAAVRLEAKGVLYQRVENCNNSPRIDLDSIHIDQLGALAQPTPHILEGFDCAGNSLGLDFSYSDSELCNHATSAPFEPQLGNPSNCVNLKGCPELNGGDWTRCYPDPLTNSITCCSGTDISGFFTWNFQVNNFGRDAIYYLINCEIPLTVQLPPWSDSSVLLDKSFGCEVDKADVRSQCYIDRGCSPCQFVKNTDLVITITDFDNTLIVVTIPIG